MGEKDREQTWFGPRQEGIMLTKEQNDLLTRTGPGTPGGELLRRYWQPAALSEELPSGGAPVAITLLGEELVLFRDEAGERGLLGLHCAHRGADLSYGRLEDGGLRCLYHGWLYDRHGRCLEQPGEPAGSTFHERITHTAYPCQEMAGIVFAYLGPGEPPLLPAYGPLVAPEAYRFKPLKHMNDCNYLQGNEGNIDPVHLSFLHQIGDLPWGGPNYTLLDRQPVIEVEATDFGLRIYAVRQAGPDERYVRITNFVMPNLCAIAGSTGQDGYQVDWHVPIDDTHHWKYTAIFQRSAPLEDREMHWYRASITPDYHRLRTAANRYGQDREELRIRTWAGLGPTFQDHDGWAVETPGAIQDRTLEHLGSTDKAIVMARLMLLKAIGDVQQGRDPLHVIREPAAVDMPHLAIRSEVIPATVDWRTYWQEPVANLVP